MTSLNITPPNANCFESTTLIQKLLDSVFRTIINSFILVLNLSSFCLGLNLLFRDLHYSPSFICPKKDSR